MRKPTCTKAPGRFDAGYQGPLCGGCEVSFINGVRCDEAGCPFAYKDSLRECAECGCEFVPESRHQRHCDESCAGGF